MYVYIYIYMCAPDRLKAASRSYLRDYDCRLVSKRGELGRGKSERSENQTCPSASRTDPIMPSAPQRSKDKTQNDRTNLDQAS